MHRFTRRRFLLAASASTLAGTAAGQSGARPLRIVTTLPPGGAADSMARFLAPRLSEALKRPVIVENRPGGNGIIGVRAVAGAPPGGEWVLMGGNSAIVTNAAVLPHLPYNPLTDLKPVAGLARYDTAIVVHAASPVRTFADLVALARQKKLNYGAGTTTYQLTVERIQRAAGFEAAAIPYKGTGPTLVDLMGHQIDFTPAEISSVVNLAREGKVRVLATAGSARAAELPQVPTLVELGFKDLVVYGFNAMFFPANVPDEQVKELSQALLAIVRTPEAGDFLRRQGGEAWPATPEEVREFMARELELARAIVTANIKIE